MSLFLAAVALFSQPTRPLELADGDRIVLVGDTLIERDQIYGYLETDILLAKPRLKLVFRNIGWSADTPTGASRAYFDGPAEGYARLVQQIRDTNPTIVVFGYGMADALIGTPADQFSQSLQRLIENLPDSVRAMVFLSPIRRAKPVLNADGVDPVDNRLVAYAAELAGLAQRLGAWFVDLQSPPFKPEAYEPNGIHLNEDGYRQLAARVTASLGLSATTPESKASDALRKMVIRKNELYFERHRPQNITYLLGFRRYEQGQNAREIEQLDTLIEKAETEINERRLAIDKENAS